MLDPSLVLAWRAWRAYDRIGGSDANAVPEGRTADVLADLDLLVEASPQDLYFRTRRAELQLRAGRSREAAADLSLVLRRSPNSLLTAYHLALLQLDLGDLQAYRTTRNVLLDLLRDRPEPPAPVMNLAAWIYSLGPDSGSDLGFAVELASKAVEVFPESDKAAAISTLGAALYRAGRYPEALEQSNESVRRFGGGGVPQDWAFLALIHQSMGDEVEARDWLERLRERPTSARPSDVWEHLEIQVLQREAEARTALPRSLPADPFAHGHNSIQINRRSVEGSSP